MPTRRAHAVRMLIVLRGHRQLHDDDPDADTFILFPQWFIIRYIYLVH